MAINKRTVCFYKLIVEETHTLRNKAGELIETVRPLSSNETFEHFS